MSVTLWLNHLKYDFPRGGRLRLKIDVWKKFYGSLIRPLVGILSNCMTVANIFHSTGSGNESSPTFQLMQK